MSKPIIQRDGDFNPKYYHQLPNIIRIPFIMNSPPSCSYPLSDFIINTTELINYIGVTLGLAEMSKFDDTDCILKPELKGYHREVIAPNIFIETTTLRLNALKDIPRILFNNSITNLATSYELYLNKILLYTIIFNDNLRRKYPNNKPLPNDKSLFELEDYYSNIVDIVSEEFNGPYWRKIKYLNNKLSINIHSSNAPLSIAETYDFTLIRNYMAHKDGYIDKRYYRNLTYHTKNNYKPIYDRYLLSTKNDFIWLIEYIKRLISQTIYIDDKISEKWNVPGFERPSTANDIKYY